MTYRQRCHENQLNNQVYSSVGVINGRELAVSFFDIFMSTRFIIRAMKQMELNFRNAAFGRTVSCVNCQLAHLHGADGSGHRADSITVPKSTNKLNRLSITGRRGQGKRAQTRTVWLWLTLGQASCVRPMSNEPTRWALDGVAIHRNDAGRVWSFMVRK
jgi:hypothetical protein